MSNPSRSIQHCGENSAVDMVSIPVSLLQKMSEAAQAFEIFQDELEDFLLSQDTAFLARMRQARTHHVEGKTRPLDALKQELCIE